MASPLSTFWSEPRPGPAPPAGRGHLWPAGFFVLATADALLRQNQPWPEVAVGLGLVVAVSLYLRNRFPFATFLVAFGVSSFLHLLALIRGVSWEAPPSHVALLLLPYSLFRWGSGREAAVGLGVLMLAYGLAAVSGDLRSPEEAIGGAVVMLFPAALGAIARFRARDQARELDEVRLRERERLARELHDTVAHHVSAIAIQAQAGQAVGARDPRKGLETLRVIEEAASRTLAEMRDIVGALRDREEAELAPQKGLADLDELRSGSGREHRVEIERGGNLDDLRPAVGAALYRMAQEAITNARRHAKNKSGIWVRVYGEADVVRLTVTDDGESVGRSDAGGGFGLLGLAERAALLGGRFEAGPGAGRGWRVEAVLPRTAGRGSAV